MKQVKNFVALDCGNSSFRVVLGRFDGERLTTEVISQTPNDMVRIFDYYYWDFLRIFDFFKAGLKKIVQSGCRIDSIGICTWGIDFALYDKKGNMLGNPLSYRNTIGEKHLGRLTPEQRKDLFYKTGIVCDKINSVYMLNGVRENFPEIFGIADKLLMIPDILNYMLTSRMLNEPSELSTTQLMDSRTRKISEDVCRIFSLKPSLFCEIGRHGREIGKVLPHILEEIGADYDIPVVCVPSHDTASAVLAIPACEKKFLFISSGTWSLIGTELEEPLICEKVLQSGLTNEVGAFNRITLLKNSAGMFIIQRIRKEYNEAARREHSWDELDEIADGYQGEIPLFNVNSSRFFNPVHMGKEIWSYLCETGQTAGNINWGAVIKSVHESMACCYAETIQNIEAITEETYPCVYIVGGGSKNIRVNELTAKRTGKTVIACSKESTSLGNLSAQIRYFMPDLTVEEIRKILWNSVEIREYKANLTEAGVIERYSKLPM